MFLRDAIKPRREKGGPKHYGSTSEAPLTTVL